MEKDRLSVLIVDDEPFQRRILREVLRSLGFVKTYEADSGQLAIAEMKKERFDLILSDVQMPGMNGLELLRQLRTGQTKLARDTRFIIITSFSNTEVIGAAMALDVNGFLAKPIRIGVVIEKVDRALQETFQLCAKDEYESVSTNLPSLEEAQRESAGAASQARGCLRNRRENDSVDAAAAWDARNQAAVHRRWDSFDSHRNRTHRDLHQSTLGRKFSFDGRTRAHS